MVDHAIESALIVRWPGRLWRVVVLDTDGVEQVSAYANYTRALAVQVIEEIPAARLFGEHGEAVVAVLSFASRLDASTAEQLAHLRHPEADQAYSHAFWQWLNRTRGSSAHGPSDEWRKHKRFLQGLPHEEWSARWLEARAHSPDPRHGRRLMTGLETVRARFAGNQGLPFADVLTEASIAQVLDEHHVEYRDRLFNPVTTLWGFLSQVLSDDHSCRDAVARVLAHRAASGLGACSPNPASYCNARKRLPTAVLRARRTAEQHQEGLPPAWKWHGRDVFVADGSHVSMPDTAENQAAYPQVYNQRPGLGFPLARLTVLLSLASGACHDLAVAPYAGKGTGETTLLRQMYGSLSPGDVVVADALFDNYFLIWELRELGVDVVVREAAERVGTRTVQSRPDGDLIVWPRPNKPRGMSDEQYRKYPKSQTIRRVDVDARGTDNRVEQFRVVTTILGGSVDGGQIGELCERRWQGELDLRSIKSVMRMDVLRCKSPEMVGKEVWAHLLAYNLLRTVMAVAAAQSAVEPRQISFKGARAFSACSLRFERGCATLR